MKQLLLSFDLILYKYVILRRTNRKNEGNTGFLSHYKHGGSHSRESGAEIRVK
jgi:hypothetical protein